MTAPPKPAIRFINFGSTSAALTSLLGRPMIIADVFVALPRPTQPLLQRWPLGRWPIHRFGGGTTNTR